MDSTIWAAIIGVGGTIGGVVVTWLLGRPAAVRNETYDQVTGSFDEPKLNALVGRTIHCSGVVSGMQPGLSLWLAIEVGNLVWPKEGKVLPDDGNWTATIFEDGATDKFSLALFVADKAADQRIKDWLDAGRRIGEYAEWKDIRGARRLARVDGLRLN